MSAHQRWRRGFTFHLLNTVLISLLLVCVAILPVAAAGLGEGSGASAGSGSGLGDDPLAASTRPYYSPDVARCFNANAVAIEERLKEVVPDEYLPDSLQPKGQYKPKQSAAPGSMSGAGTGGWMDLSRPYTPSADPDIIYRANTGGGVLDSSGRLHSFYSMAVRTDISQPPDVAGFKFQNLSATHYSEYSDGSWSSPVDVTPVAGLEDSDVLLFDVDSDDYLHLVYSKWTWGRDSTCLAGDWNAYQHQDEDIWYRYRTPAGSWSDPVRLTSYSGADWGIMGASFRLVNNRIYGAWVTVLNRETLPSSYRAEVGFIDGLLGAWSDIEVLSAWEFTQDPGQVIPNYWPEIGVSDQGGEVAVTYATATFGGVPYSYRGDMNGAVRGTDGVWSAVEKITSATDNQVWMSLFILYGGENTARVLAVRFNNTLDVTHPPHDNFYFIYHAGGEWQAPVNITGASSGYVGTLFNLRLDPFDDMHILYAITTCAWDGGTWTPQGDRLRYTREEGGGLSTPETLHGYEAGRFVGDTALVIDRDGGRHALFMTYREAGGVMSEFNVYYACSAPGGTGGAFSAPVKLRGDVDNEIFSFNLSTFPGGDVLASWLEMRFSGTGVPEVGVIYSRMWDGTEWSGTENITDVAGSADIVHTSAVGWPGYTDQRGNDRGEQQCLFETAKYNEVTAEYHDFNKYFIETVNGIWTAPELVSDLEFAGEYPRMYVDGNQRLFVLYESADAGAGKEVVYATMQPEPTPPATTYYFAEGTTRAGFEEWICVQNPGDEAADVSITYMLETGENIVENVTVGPHSRTTVNVSAAVGPEHDVSAKVESDRLIVAERPMYFDFRGWRGGHDAVGALNTSRLWYFAEGTTRGGFAEYLTIQNPADRNATVDVTYVLDDGTTITEPVSVGARSRATVDVNAVVGEGRDVSMVVECDDVAIVAERPMYFDYNGWTGGHNVMGATSLANRWYFAEGTTRSGFDTYLCVGNPNSIDADVTMRFVLGDGAEVVHPLNVPATSRQTVKVNDIVGEGNDVSAVIDSTGPVLIERPMYFNYREKWTGGHVAMGARSPKNSWFFAEGTTRDGFEEWLSLENPGMVDATADISYMLEDGSVTDTTVAVPAHTRVTVDVPLAVGPGRDVSVAVWSDIAIIVERPMYFLYHGMWPGGHDVVGL